MKSTLLLLTQLRTKAPTGKTVFALEILVHGAQDCKEPRLSGANPAFDRQPK